MKYLKNTIAEHILRADASGTFRYVLPSYPAQLLFELGKQLQEAYATSDTRFIYGIAYRLGERWKTQGSAQEQNYFTKICERKWYNHDNNLTSLRNEIRLNERRLVIVMAGYEDIDDQKSLQDFFHLDQINLWESCLGKSFVPWVNSALKRYVNLEEEAGTIDQIAKIFKVFYEQGVADLLTISQYLESADFTQIMTSKEAMEQILNELAFFKLPKMGFMAKGKKSKSLASYIAPAQDFLSYNLFIERTTRKKYLEKLRKFKDSNEEIAPDILGDFIASKELLDTLEAYITSGKPVLLEKLKKADFVYIYDKILGYKGKESHIEPVGPKLKKLKGMPPEVFLRALWLTIGEYKTTAKRFAPDNLSRLEIVTTSFKHNVYAGESGDKKESNQQAAVFLQKSLGGIDRYLEEKIRLEEVSKDGLTLFDMKFESKICPKDFSDISFEQKITTEPLLKFTVRITTADGGNFKREFAWAIPDNHQVRLLVELYDWAIEGFQRGSGIPIFLIPYMKEIFMANDEEEVNRLISLAIKKEEVKKESERCFENLHQLRNDLLRSPMSNLSTSYEAYLMGYRREGFYSALLESYDGLRKSYTAALKKYLEISEQSDGGPLLFKAFLITGEEYRKKDTWIWDEHLDTAIVSPLHPALIEVLVHQYVFLCDAFAMEIKKALPDSNKKLLTEKRWNKLVDMAKVAWPIYGTLRSNHLLDTNVRGFGYFHLVGTSEDSTNWANSRLLLEYDEDDEEDITDAELFMESKASQLVTRTLDDFRVTYDYANDGLSIGAYCGKDLQPLIAGLDNYLENLLSQNSDTQYSLRLTIISDSSDDSGVLRWVNAWKTRWQEAGTSGNKAHYENCHISITYRLIQADTSSKYSDFENLVKSGLEFDIFFFLDFIKSNASRFQIIDKVEGSSANRLKFPILEKICCSLRGGGRESRRDRIINHQRFVLGALHAEVLARLSRQERNKSHAVISTADFRPWQKIVDEIHNHCVWAVVIDASVDEKLLQLTGNDEQRRREIIGFGTGVGSHGENNYTISTEHFSIVDIIDKISAQVSDLFGETHDAKQIARSLVKETANIAGLSLVKATGPSQYVRDFMAYSLVRKLLPRDETIFCDVVVSLDTFRHWFDEASDNQRPDLLRLLVRIKDHQFHIQAQLIECKLAASSEGYLEKARQQLESGLRVLVPSFRPLLEDENSDENSYPPIERYDQRYWWMQLHRLIAGKAEIEKNQEQAVLYALELLSEGYYGISWQAAAIAFWTDEDRNFQVDGRWDFSYDGQELKIVVATAGKSFVKGVCLNQEKGNIFVNDSRLHYGSVQYAHSVNDEGMLGQEVEHEESSDQNVNGTIISNQATQPATDEHPEERNDKELRKPADDQLKGDSQGGQAGGAINKVIPQRILLGTSGEREICWEFGHPDLPNRHMLVFGASGTGKTYTIQALMLELAKLGQNSLVVDYTNGFTTNQLDSVIRDNLNPKQHLVRREPLPINPFRKQTDVIDEFVLEEEPQQIAERVTGVFSEVYNLGDQQRSAIYSVIQEGIAIYGNSFNLRQLLDLLDQAKSEGGPAANYAASVYSKIQPFVDTNPFGKEDTNSWEGIFSDEESRCHVIQLATFSKENSKLITEFSLIDLYRYSRAGGNKDKPKVVILDEIQNLDHRLESPLGQFLTEGRKFGISLILATQTLSNLEKDERDRLFQASHKLFFKPAETEIRSYAQILADSTRSRVDEWIDKLSGLQKGECYSLGYALNEATGKLVVNIPFKVKIQALTKRI